MQDRDQTDVRPRVLFVDDEPNLLAGIQRGLGRHFQVSTTVSGTLGLELIASRGPFHVVVSDYRMPVMDGAAFLARVKQAAPSTSRILLTGHADLDAVVHVVNDGQIFRFLMKPCPPAALFDAVNDGIRQYDLVVAERVLLEQTLRGAIRTLIDVLSIASPAAFGRATRIRKTAVTLAEQLRVPDPWQVEVAAMLSQIGWITLPPALLEKVSSRTPLQDAERDLVTRLPETSAQLLAHIPRIDSICQMMLRSVHATEAGGKRPTEVSHMGRAILLAVLDREELVDSGFSPEAAVEILLGRAGAYDPKVIAALERLEGGGRSTELIREFRVAELQVGGTLAEDVVTPGGMTIVAAGEDISGTLLLRLRNFALTSGVREPIRVIYAREAKDAPGHPAEGKRDAA